VLFKISIAKAMITISIIIPVRNRKTLTQQILQQLQTQMTAVSHQLQITVFVVYDGSTDGTPEMIRQQFPITFSRFLSRSEDLKNYIQQRQAPSEIAEAVLNMRN
jgi:glycosyltransferase involved in cell wall biosynthesis